MYHGEMRMTGSGPAVMPQNLAQEPEIETIDTRFGKVTISRVRPIVFVNGMLGMPDRHQFCLTNFPSEKLARFKLLQSLEETPLSFITLPVEIDNPVVERADLEQAAADLDIAANELLVLFIVTVHRDSSGVQLSVNARAPILVDTLKRLAVQFVFPNPKYDIRHMITV